MSELESKIESLADKNVSLERENKILREELALLKHGLFGRKTERLDPSQIAMFAGEEGEQAGADAAPQGAKVEKHKRKGHGRAPFAPHVPRETIELDVAAEDRACHACGKEMHAIGVDVTERGKQIELHPRQHRHRTEDGVGVADDRCRFERLVGHVRNVPDGFADRSIIEVPSRSHYDSEMVRAASPG